MSTATNGPRTILVVDDFDDTRLLLRTWLERRGFRVIEAANGIQAINQAETEAPDLIIMDMQMPELDGLSATRRIRKSLDSVPILAVSAYGADQFRELALAAGCNEYVSTPFEPATLEGNHSLTGPALSIISPMFRTILFSLLLLLLPQTVPAQCTKKMSELPAAPELLGFRLGMTKEQIKAHVPQTKFGTTDHFGVSKTTINPYFDETIDKSKFHGRAQHLARSCRRKAHFHLDRVRRNVQGHTRRTSL